MSVSDETLAAVKRKLNVTWDEAETDSRIADVVDTVTPTLNARLGYEGAHVFASADGGAWALFLNACLYEFSDALDDFLRNYSEELDIQRALNLANADTSEAVTDGS